MFVGVILPEFDTVFAADVDIYPATNIVGFGIVGKFLRIIADCNEPISQKLLVTSGKRFKKLKDFVVNEKAIAHRQSPEGPIRRSKSSSVANSEAGRSIFSASFFR